VNAFFLGKEVATFSLVETTWINWKTMYPETKVLSRGTGSTRNYDRYPYVGRTGDQDYRTDPFLLFPISRDDRRLPRKERTLGVFVNDNIKAYRFTSFPGDVLTIIQENFRGEDIVVVGSKDRNFMLAFKSILEDGTSLTFEPVNNLNSSLILKDNEGNEWDVFGEALSGPRTGERLVPIRSFIGFWFTWESFYPGVVIHDFDG